MKIVKLLIGIPSGDEWKKDTALSMIFLTSYLMRTPVRIKGEDHAVAFSIHCVSTSVLPQARQNIIEHAMNGDFTHLLFVDSDMRFPQFLVHKMLEADKDVIACNCPTRKHPSNSTARGFEQEVIPLNLEGLGKVRRVGTGVMMIRVSALRKLPRPAFTPYWHPSAHNYVGEDWAFVEHLESAGYDIWVDHSLSQKIGHIGHHTYTAEDTFHDEK